MTDIFDRDKRSEIMSHIRGSGNRSTEERLIAIFNDLKLTGWRRHYKVKGKPDFVFMDQRTAIFVDGCFWHGHDCRNTRPKSNSEFWNEKISKNMKHDLDVTDKFTKRGWTVIRIWECELGKKSRMRVLHKLQTLLLDVVMLENEMKNPWIC